LTTLEPDEQGKTAPIEPGPDVRRETEPMPAQELPAQANHEAVSPSAPPQGEPPTSEVVEPVVQLPPEAPTIVGTDGTAALVSRTAAPSEQNVTFVPLAVSIGDGFKFGCGFFLASVVALLIAFVVLAALFVLTGLFGLNLPIGR
jgi:hypothetical protein